MSPLAKYSTLPAGLSSSEDDTPDAVPVALQFGGGGGTQESQDEFWNALDLKGVSGRKQAAGPSTVPAVAGGEGWKVGKPATTPTAQTRGAVAPSTPRIVRPRPHAGTPPQTVDRPLSQQSTLTTADDLNPFLSTPRVSRQQQQQQSQSRQSESQSQPLLYASPPTPVRQPAAPSVMSADSIHAYVKTLERKLLAVTKSRDELREMLKIAKEGAHRGPRVCEQCEKSL